jgi:hypothetical protein
LTTDISSKDELFSGFFDIHHLEFSPRMNHAAAWMICMGEKGGFPCW